MEGVLSTGPPRLDYIALVFFKIVPLAVIAQAPVTELTADSFVGGYL